MSQALNDINAAARSTEIKVRKEVAALTIGWFALLAVIAFFVS